MKRLVAPAALVLLAASVPVRAAAHQAEDELAFGVGVARKGLWQEARFRFERALALSPDDPSALNDLAIALEQQGDFDKARAAYQKALQL